MPPHEAAVNQKRQPPAHYATGGKRDAKTIVFPLRLQYATARGVASTATVQDEPRASASVRGALALVVG